MLASATRRALSVILMTNRPITCLLVVTSLRQYGVVLALPNIFAFSIRDLLSLYKELGLSEKKRVAVQGIIMITCWSIWRARNNVKFSNASVRIESIISEIKALSFLWFSNRSRFKGLDWKDWSSFVNM
ncbi:hypothetical protein HanIR_Chr11g0506601 [Helianthus annuus]|nr:hypothetical protein HanIR_Chr11g0506601 [Helianthus annuus]